MEVHNTQMITDVQRDRRGRMEVGFLTIYAISAYHRWRCEFESRSSEVYSIQQYVIKFSPGTPVFPAKYNWNIVESGAMHHIPIGKPRVSPLRFSRSCDECTIPLTLTVIQTQNTQIYGVSPPNVPDVDAVLAISMSTTRCVRSAFIVRWASQHSGQRASSHSTHHFAAVTSFPFLRHGSQVVIII